MEGLWAPSFPTPLPHPLQAHKLKLEATEALRGLWSAPGPGTGHRMNCIIPPYPITSTEMASLVDIDAFREVTVDLAVRNKWVGPLNQLRD